MKNRTTRVRHFERMYRRMATVKKTTVVKEDVKKAAKPAVKAEIKTEAKPAAKAEVKAAEPVKAEVKKAETKAPAKKAAAKKAPAAKKAAVKESVSVQFSGKSYTTEELVKIAKDVWKYDLKKKVSDFRSVELYVKPEESQVYYVINGEVSGSFAI